MRSTAVGSTLLLLAGATAAQTTEDVFTIQTSIPAGSSPSDAVPLPVPSDVSFSSVPPVSLPSPIDVSLSSVPPVSLPSPSDVSFEDVTMTLPVESLPSVGSEPAPTATITNPNSQTTDPAMSIPQGETPESTGAIETSSGSSNASSSASGSAPAEQTTAAAPPSLKGDSTQFMLALGLSGVSILFGAAWTLL
ncbi:hypothetical protein SVAN01_08523 [Stagonosporopsis vannaccii]|nr:hypothetical protein SVAN01_08523 [Stagonosporopsis vannaccii]